MAEKIVLAIVDFKKRDAWPAEEMADELKDLVVSCGGDVVDVVICKCDRPSADLLIGQGKAREIMEICLSEDAQTVVFSQDLKGSQQRNLEDILKAKTIDRTQLILDIFARRAKSKEGKMQVELAQLEYLRPRLVGHGIELSRLGGGIGTLGPGETKLEVDRRRIDSRITKLRKDLKGVTQNRQIKRKKRKEQQIPVISLVGYTNAGKSTLLNTLTHAEQTTRDGLFTTLDPLARQLILPNRQKIVISDTVGFMYELPHHLIESFKATLEEAIEADLLIHVLDVSNPRFRHLNDAVMDVLEELGIREKPILTVFNKIDKLEDRVWLKDLKENFEHAVLISALTGENIDELTDEIIQLVETPVEEIDVEIPINRMDLVNLVHEKGQVHSIEYSGNSVHIQATVSKKLANKVNSIAQ